VIAIPVKYGEAGIMTFVISKDGIVCQRDLGADTQKLAASVMEYIPTSEWEPVK